MHPNRAMMEDKRKKRSPKVSLPQPPPPPINPRKLPALPASKSATFSLGLPQPPSPKNRGKCKRSVGQAGQPKEVFAAVIAPPKTARCVSLFHFSPTAACKWASNDSNMLFGVTTKVFCHISLCLFVTQSPQGETSGPAASRAQQGGPVLSPAALLPDRRVRCQGDGGRPPQPPQRLPLRQTAGLW